MNQHTNTSQTRRSEPPDESSSDGEIPRREPPQEDVVFDVLQNARRRRILTYLDSVESTSIRELSRHIAAVENGIDEREVSSAQRKLIYVSLYQSHLPKLADAGCIDYDSDRGTVEPTPAMQEYLGVLDKFAMARGETGPSRWKYTLASAGLLATLLALVVTSPLSWLHQVGLAAALSLGSLAMIALAHRR